jgi:hypothetical protein
MTKIKILKPIWEGLLDTRIFKNMKNMFTLISKGMLRVPPPLFNQKILKTIVFVYAQVDQSDKYPIRIR